jgi:ABC-type oligopeptide transport system ATPase subunit
MNLTHQVSFDAAHETARKLAYGYIEKYYIQKSMLQKTRKTCRAAYTIQKHWRTYAAETRSYGQIILKQLHRKTKQAIKRITSKSKKNGSLKKLDQLFVYNAREYLQDTISLDDHRIELLARYIQIELILRNIQWKVSVQ